MDALRPDWPAPPAVRALTTTRVGGVSRPPWDGFNLAAHVGDRPAHVARNRSLLRSRFGLPGDPAWLSQVHGTDVLEAGRGGEADAVWTDVPGRVCAVLTADCLPVLFCADAGTCVAAAHAGWRGLAAGVLEATVAALPAEPAGLLAWLGPAIGPDAFEVGDEVRSAFVGRDAGAAAAFRPAGAGRWLADLYALARLRLAAAGVTRVSGGGWCTFDDRDRFYSYRRDGITGRMASLVWLQP